MNFWKKYYDVQRDKLFQHLPNNIVDIILLLGYVGISFYNAIGNISKIRSTTDTTGITEDLKFTVDLIIFLNIIVLARKHLKLNLKIKDYREDEKARLKKERKVVSEIYILAWKEKSHIINYGYLSIAVILLVIHITGYQILYPAGLVAIFVTGVTMLIELIDIVEDIFGLVPITYLGERG